jgi:hypothetical protein
MVLADKFLRGGTKKTAELALSQDCQGNQEWAAGFACVSPTALLEIPESLLTQAGVIHAGPALQLLMQRIC